MGALFEIYMNRKDYCEDAQWEFLKKSSEKLNTPFLLLDLDEVRRNYANLHSHFDYAKIYYAVKANPHPAIIKALAEEGSNFDIASIYEMDQVLGLGVSPERLSFGNTIKKPNDIAYAFGKGVTLYVSDCESDLRAIAHNAPGSRVFIRILSEGATTADWPLSRKFGCQADMAYDLLVLARDLGLNPYGLSFHVGSQQREIGTWDAAIAKVSFLFHSLLEEEGISLKMINLGGGFPSHYTTRANPLDVYASEIRRYLDDDFPEGLPEILIEPGRAMTGSAGVIVSEVVQMSRKSRHSLLRWIYLDAGKFNGMIETLEEAIRYPIFSAREGEELEPAVLAGPTCDSTDIMYEQAPYPLPIGLCEGDKVFVFSAGAYTSTYCSVEFNGFPPLQTHVLQEL